MIFSELRQEIRLNKNSIPLREHTTPDFVKKFVVLPVGKLTEHLKMANHKQRERREGEREGGRERRHTCDSFILWTGTHAFYHARKHTDSEVGTMHLQSASAVDHCATLRAIQVEGFLVSVQNVNCYAKKHTITDILYHVS